MPLSVQLLFSSPALKSNHHTLKRRLGLCVEIISYLDFDFKLCLTFLCMEPTMHLVGTLKASGGLERLVHWEEVQIPQGLPWKRSPSLCLCMSGLGLYLL